MKLKSIQHKMWLCMASIIVGYFIATLLSYHNGAGMERELEIIKTKRFPAAISSTDLLNTMNKQFKLYEDGILLGDDMAIQQGDALGKNVQSLLVLLNEMILAGSEEFQIVNALQKMYQQYFQVAPRVFAQIAAGESSTGLQSQVQQLKVLEPQMSEQATVLNDKLIAVTEKNLDVLKQDSTHLVKLLIGLFFVVIVVSGLISQLIMRKLILSPLNRIVQMVKDLTAGEGDLTQRLAFESYDELGEIANYFNTFLDNLQSMIAHIKDLAVKVAHGSNSISETMEAISHSTEDQASTSQELSAAIMEISANTDEVASNTQEVSAAIQQTAQTIQKIQLGVHRLDEHIDQLNAKSLNVSQASERGVQSIEENDRTIRNIVHSSEVINQKMGAVVDVAEQIKLLALNAAIVAAQAGEHGRGFSVVADAINNLAQQAGKTAAEITALSQKNLDTAQHGIEISQQTLELIHNIQSSAAESSSIAELVKDEVAEQVVATNQITAATEEVAQNTAHVSQAIGQQSQSVGQITQATEDLASNSSQNAIGIQDMQRSNEELDQIANELRHMVERFRTDKGNGLTPLQ